MSGGVDVLCRVGDTEPRIVSLRLDGQDQLSVTISFPLDDSTDRSEFEASAIEPVRLPGCEEEDGCKHARDCDECGPNEIWVHETATLIRGWADAIFRLADAPALGEGLALSAIRPIAVALAQQANGLVGYTRGSFAAGPSLKVVSH